MRRSIIELAGAHRSTAERTSRQMCWYALPCGLDLGSASCAVKLSQGAGLCAPVPKRRVGCRAPCCPTPRSQRRVARSCACWPRRTPARRLHPGHAAPTHGTPARAPPLPAHRELDQLAEEVALRQAEERVHHGVVWLVKLVAHRAPVVHIVALVAGQGPVGGEGWGCREAGGGGGVAWVPGSPSWISSTSVG